MLNHFSPIINEFSAVISATVHVRNAMA